MTTEPRPRPERSSKPLLRAWAWIVAAVSFFTPAAGFAMHSAAAPAGTGTEGQVPDVIIRRVIRRVVIEAPTPGAAPRIVYVNPSTSAASSSSAPPATSPVATTGGS